MSTLNQQNWGWYVGYTDEEYSSGPYQTRAEAVQIAKEEFEGAYIVEAYKQPESLAAHFDANRFLEYAEENVYDMANPDGDPIFDPTGAQIDDLEKRVRATIERWQEDHKLVFMPWMFTDTRNEEFIDGEMGDS